MTQTFRVHVTKDYLKFNAAHFIAYKGFREALHGHNYRVSVDIEAGERHHPVACLVGAGLTSEGTEDHPHRDEHDPGERTDRGPR